MVGKSPRHRDRAVATRCRQRLAIFQSSFSISGGVLRRDIPRGAQRFRHVILKVYA
jgi:hypothetical protein